MFATFSEALAYVRRRTWEAARAVVATESGFYVVSAARADVLERNGYAVVWC